jgi:hypothetical protein
MLLITAAWWAAAAHLALTSSRGILQGRHPRMSRSEQKQATGQFAVVMI